MALERVPVPVNLTEGIDTKTDEKLSLKPSVMENMSHEGKGTPKKRFGLSSLPKNIEGGGVITDGVYAFGYEDQALIATSDGVYIYKESTQEWQKISEVRLSTLRTRFISSPFSFGTSIENGTLSGMVKTTDYDIYIMNETASGVGEAVIVERSSGRIIGNSIFSVDAKIEVLNDVPYAYYPDGTTIKEKNIITGAISNVTSDLNSKFDVTSDGTDAYFVYESGTGDVKITKWGPGGTTTSTFAEAGTIVSNSYPAIDFNGTNINVCYHTDDGGAKIKHFQINTALGITVTLAEVATTFVVGRIVLSCVEISDELFVGYYDTNEVKSYIYNYDLALQTASLVSESLGVNLASKLYVYNSQVFFLGKMFDGTEINYILFDKNFTPQAMIKSFDTTSFTSIYYNLNDIGSGFEVPYIEDKRFIKVATMDFSFEDAGDFVEFGKDTYVPGSMPLKYNGLVLSESQFLGRPAIVQILSAGGAIPAGTYDYIAVYEYVEPNGNIVRSEPSDQVSITAGGAFSANIEINTLKVSLISDLFIRVRIYRKEQSETVFKLINTYLLNDRTNDTITINDNEPSLDGNVALYTTGELLPNQTMPAILSYGFSNNRLFGVIEENQIIYSKKYVIGEGLQFNNFQTLNTEDNQNRRADELVATASMDNKLIMFKEDTILALFGDGPDGTGATTASGQKAVAGPAFSEPELVTTDVGCINPRSIVSTGAGLMFQSRKGIYILQRNMAVEYLGAPVEGFNDLKITGAVLMEDVNQVRWTTKDGVSIVYDYYYNQWSTFSGYESLACFIHKGKISILKSDGSFLSETNAFNDDSEFIPQKLVTGWLKIGGPQDYQRVYRMLILGEWRNKHKVKVKVYYDYQDYVSDEYILDATEDKYERSDEPSYAEIESGGNPGEYQFNIHFKKQKCKAIRVSIEDVKAGGVVGESFRLTDLTFVVGRKKGTFKTRGEVQY